MNELVNTKLFSVLSEPTQVTNEEILNAYGCFMKQVETASQSDNPYSVVYRMLTNTRTEFVFLELLHRYEQGEKCFEICLS